MAQIINITSEAIQATIRRLLPSQQGFGEDMQASNVITPIIDLTPTAEGSVLPTDLARSFAHGSITAFSVSNTTSTIINTTGFYRVFGTWSVQDSNGSETQSISISDGLSSKVIYSARAIPGGFQTVTNDFDFIVFCSSGDSVSVTASLNGIVAGNTRQVADVNGNITNPDGFSFE